LLEQWHHYYSFHNHQPGNLIKIKIKSLYNSFHIILEIKHNYHMTMILNNSITTMHFTITNLLV
ncbi:hypothetical protein Leryth_011001, partial [Lithospermum erythrorhizon]